MKRKNYKNKKRIESTKKMKYKNMIVNVELDSEVNELFAKTKVIQKFKNTLKEPLELKIYVYKEIGLLFSSFSAKIGDSITVKSKVIKKDKAEEKYNDSISSGNAAIFVCEDEYNPNRVIINMGNIPSEEEVTFISEYLNPIETSKSYEFELFRNLPIFGGNGVIYNNSKLEGTIHIKTKNKNWIVGKEILMDNLKIEKEYYDNKEKNNYLIKYKIDKLPTFYEYNLDYIPSSKIYYEIEDDEKPIVYSQKSSLEKAECNYFIQYKIKKNSEEENNIEENPALFIFLIDQSGSMSGTSIKIAANALKLFIQSLPAKSYYQIIGFGSTYRKYDEIPKEYNQKNIDESIKLIEKLKADLGGTDIYSPLKFIYDSAKEYENINLPRNIFLLTDGEILDKDKTLKIIENNSNNFSLYSIGIGNSFDKDLIKNAGILGKGNYNFCNKLDSLNSIIASEISKAISPYISKLDIKTSLDQIDIIKNNKIKNIIREDEIINLNYITKEEKVDKIKIDINYLENDKKIQKIFDITPLEIPEGEEFSKLIYNNYILNFDYSSKEKIDLALKYQIFNKYTSLFAEIELSEKASTKMKSHTVGNKQQNSIIIRKKKSFEHRYDYMKNSRFNFIKSKKKALLPRRSRMGERSRSRERCRSMEWSRSLNYKSEEIGEKENKKMRTDKDLFLSKRKEDSKKDLKDEVMKIINTQNFIEGYWNENKQTKVIKEKYKKEYDLVKNLKIEKINDNVAITVIIIYFIYKEHFELLKELSRIIQKAKLFIKKVTKMSYEKIIKDIGIN